TTLKGRASRAVFCPPPTTTLKGRASRAVFCPPPTTTLKGRASRKRGEGILEGSSPRSRCPVPRSRAQAEPSRTDECATSTAGHPLGRNRVPNFPKKKPGGLTHGYPTGV